MKKINIDLKNIQQLLSGQKYKIDIYQREYNWTEKESILLLNDILYTFNREYDKGNRNIQSFEEYYLWNIILTWDIESVDWNYKNIIDWQQRITTLTILWIFLLHYCRINKISEAIEQDLFKIIKNKSYDNTIEDSWIIDIKGREIGMEQIFTNEWKTNTWLNKDLNLEIEKKKQNKGIKNFNK